MGVRVHGGGREDVSVRRLHRREGDKGDVGEARGNPSDGYEDEGRAALGGYSGGEQGQRPP